MGKFAWERCMVNERNMSLIANIKPELTDSIQCYMRISILTVILPATFLSGFMLGLYFTLLYQNRLHVLGQTGIFIPIISAFAGGVGGLKLIYEWSKELALKFDGTISKEVHYSIGNGRDLVTQLYCLRVKRKVLAEPKVERDKLKSKESILISIQHCGTTKKILRY
jgi:hypothetical protein